MKIIGIRFAVAVQKNAARNVILSQEICSSMPEPSGHESVSAPSMAENFSPTSSAPSEPHIIINRSSRQVTVDQHLIPMAKRSVDVLIVLAKALIAGSGPVSTTELKEALFAEITADNAVAVAIKAPDKVTILP